MTTEEFNAAYDAASDVDEAWTLWDELAASIAEAQPADEQDQAA